MANRNNTFILKRSNVVGKVPSLSGLTLGEIALNTADAKLYSLYTAGLTGATEVREIGWDKLSITGNTSGNCITDLFVTNLNSCSPLHIQNVSNGDVLIGENGGVNVGIGTSTPTSKLDINLGGVSGGTIALQTRGSIPYLTSNRTTFSINNNGRLTAGFVGDVTALPPTLGHTLAAPVGATNAFSVSSDSLTQGLFFINTDGSFSLGNSVIGAGMFESNGVDTFYFGSVLNKQKIGINTNTPSASLHTVGSDSSSNYGLKVQNSGTTNTLSVRNDGFVEGDGYQGNSFQLGSYNPFIEGSLSVGRAEKDSNTTFTIVGANYPKIYFDSVYSTKIALTSGAGGQRLELADNVNPKFTWLSSTNIGINLPSTASTINSTLEVNGSTSTTTLKVTSGAIAGYVLTALDSTGNVYWASPVSGSSPSLLDTYVTGFTYSNNNLTIGQNQGQSPLTVNVSTMTGLTINGNLTATTIQTDYIDFNQNYAGATAQGRINWDTGTGTLNIGVGDSTTSLIDLQVGQEELVRVYNSEATTLLKGEVVYVSGSQGNRPKVKRAQAISDGYSVTTLGMVSENITSGSEGYVTTFGIISNLNTLGLTGGTPIWLSPTVAGGYTETKPQAPNHTVLIGYVVRVSATVGSVFVNISNGWELDELHDVRISGATNGDLLMRSTYSGSPVWVNTKTLNGNYIIDGSISATTYYGLPIDIYTTGGTYSNSTGIASFTNNNGGSFNVSGFFKPSDDVYVTGGTYSNGTLTLNRQNGSVSISGFLTGSTNTGTDTYVTGFTYSNNNLTIGQNQGQSPLTVNVSTMTGLTINGTISATTYVGLPASTISVSIDGVGGIISTGTKAYLPIPYAATINGWTIVSPISGSCVIDVWKANNTIPTVANTIAGSEKPTLSSQQINTNNTLSSWTTSVTANDIIAFNVDSATTVTSVTLVLKITKL